VAGLAIRLALMIGVAVQSHLLLAAVAVGAAAEEAILVPTYIIHQNTLI
jgi:hypothetical protein